MLRKLKIAAKQMRVSRKFFKKLKHNFHEFTFSEKILYFLFLRWFSDKTERFFFEGSVMVPGQMYIQERKALYDLVIRYNPGHCFEIGTYTGGGSTFFLASAFEKIGTGKVVTLENDRYLFDFASNHFRKFLPSLAKHIDFVFGDNLSYFNEYLDRYKTVDFIFLDGAEDRNQTKDQYEAFFKYFKPGTILAVHDWNTEKTATLKPIVLADANWEKIVELEPPVSVGFAAFKRK